MSFFDTEEAMLLCSDIPPRIKGKSGLKASAQFGAKKDIHIPQQQPVR
jgi:hypothetical protein